MLILKYIKLINACVLLLHVVGFYLRCTDITDFLFIHRGQRSMRNTPGPVFPSALSQNTVCLSCIIWTDFNWENSPENWSKVFLGGNIAEIPQHACSGASRSHCPLQCQLADGCIWHVAGSVGHSSCHHGDRLLLLVGIVAQYGGLPRMFQPHTDLSSPQWGLFQWFCHPEEQTAGLILKSFPVSNSNTCSVLHRLYSMHTKLFGLLSQKRLNLHQGPINGSPLKEIWNLLLLIIFLLRYYSKCYISLMKETILL